MDLRRSWLDGDSVSSGSCVDACVIGVAIRHEDVDRINRGEMLLLTRGVAGKRDKRQRERTSW